ncbi:MAG: TatD family hydrolase [Nannocystis sp.]|nr:TatD family hydrolase [Nannocystis sp.]MBA3549267.1 TatD family hydrolase [Nannocystis sp.]
MPAIPTPPTIPGLIDTHCHLDYPPMSEDLAGTLERAAAAGVVRCVHIGCSPAAWAPALALAEAHEQVHAVIGIHPHEAVLADDAALRELAGLLTHPRVVAVGETGLDYFYDRSPRAQQLEAMARQLELARACEKPIVLHIRDAHADAWAVVDAQAPVPGIIHCFTGTPDEARAWLDRGYHLSFSGIATFPSAPGPREAARICPADRILLETDAPYLAPVPVRGRKNEPAYIAFTCAQLAQVRGEPPEQLARAAAANAKTLLKLPG